MNLNLSPNSVIAKSETTKFYVQILDLARSNFCTLYRSNLIEVRPVISLDRSSFYNLFNQSTFKQGFSIADQAISGHTLIIA